MLNVAGAELLAPPESLSDLSEDPFPWTQCLGTGGPLLFADLLRWQVSALQVCFVFFFRVRGSEGLNNLHVMDVFIRCTYHAEVVQFLMSKVRFMHVLLCMHFSCLRPLTTTCPRAGTEAVLLHQGAQT